jgi:hypothetical protein
MRYVEARDYFTFKPNEVRRERECARYIFTPLPVLGSVVEVFGGFGLMLELLEDMGKVTPATEVVAWDHSPSCIRARRDRWPGHRNVVTDSFTMSVPPAELVSVDFNTFSPLKAHRVRRYRRLLDGVFGVDPQWVQLTDSAPSKLHMNAVSYRRFFGRRVVDVKSYLKACSAWYEAEYGYSVRAAAWHTNAAYCLLSPGPASKWSPVKVS